MSWSYSHSITINSASRQTRTVSSVNNLLYLMQDARKRDTWGKWGVGRSDQLNQVEACHLFFFSFCFLLSLSPSLSFYIGLCQRHLTYSGKSMHHRINGPCPWFSFCAYWLCVLEQVPFYLWALFPHLENVNFIELYELYWAL